MSYRAAFPALPVLSNGLKSHFITPSKFVAASPSVSETTQPKQTNLNGTFITDGLAALSGSLDILTVLGNDLFKQMVQRQEVTRNAQACANEMDTVIASLVHDTDLGALPDNVYLYLKNNRFTVRGKAGEQTIDEFLADKERDKLDKGQLNTIKLALESVANRTSDFVSSTQLKVQRLTQNYSVIISLMGSLQTMAYDLANRIIQSIRG